MRGAASEGTAIPITFTILHGIKTPNLNLGRYSFLELVAIRQLPVASL